MKAVFVHDNRFVEAPDGHVYSLWGFPYEHWNRYLRFCDELEVVGRREDTVFDKSSLGQLNVSSGPSVSFFWAPNLNHPLYFVTCRQEAWALLYERISQADVLITRGSTLGRLAALVAQELHKPYLYEVVGCPWDSLWNYGTWQAKAYAPMAWWSSRRIIKRSPFVSYVSQQFLQQRYPTEGKCVAVSDVMLPEQSEEILARRIEKIERVDQNLFVMGIIGAFNHRYKGIDVAIRALGKVKDKLPPFELRLLGRGDRLAIQRTIDKAGLRAAVVFCEPLQSGDAVFEWLDDIDLYLQPSFQEGLPRSVVEAMGRACPVLGSTAGGIPELLEEDCLHKPGNVAQLAEQLIGAVESRTWQLQKARRNFEEAKRYSIAETQNVHDAFMQTFFDAIKAT